MKEINNAKPEMKEEGLLPEGILCAGYCKNCRHSEPYNDQWLYCDYHRKTVDPLEWHECCE